MFVTGVPCLQHGCVRRGAKQETLFRRKFLDRQPEENELGPRPESNRKPMIMVGSKFQPAIHSCNQSPYDEDNLCKAVDRLTLVTQDIAATP